MAWPWPPLHETYRAFDGMSEEDARFHVSRMLGGMRREIIVDSCVFGAIVWALAAVPTCAGSLWGLSSLNSELRLLIPAAAGCVAAYFAVTWRYQRLAAHVLDTRLGAYGDISWNVCTQCRYPLSGLPVVDRVVTCPECGAKNVTPMNDPNNGM